MATLQKRTVNFKFYYRREELSMNTSIIKKAALSTLLLLAISTVHADDWTGNISGYLGQKSLDNKDWGKQDQQGSLGVLFDIKQQSWPVSIAADMIVSGDADENGSQKDEAITVEQHLGVRKIFELPNSKVKYVYLPCSESNFPIFAP